MEKIDLSTNSKKLQAAYDNVVKGDGLSTYAVFSVAKNGIVDLSDSGSGSLDEFVEQFSDGQVQFGFARVTVPGSDVYKNILLGWCPDNAPAKLRLLFAANFAEVSRVFPGYHVQITARDNDDLDPEEFLSRVGAAAGARYTYHASSNVAATSSKSDVKQPITSRPTSSGSSATDKPKGPKPAYAAPGKPSPVVQPAFGAKPSFGSKPPVASKPAFKAAPKLTTPSNDNDGWGGEKEIEERDFHEKPLEDVPSAYVPTKVNIEELRKQKSDTISSTPKPTNPNSTTSDNKDLSSKLDGLIKSFSTSSNGRLSSLPKPKVSNNVASRYAPSADVKQPSFGSKPAFGSTPVKKEKPEGVFQVHGNENGLTPAQLWAQKRGKYKVEPILDEAPESGVAAISLELNDDKVKEVQEEQKEEEDEDSHDPEPVKKGTSFANRSLPPRNIEPILPKRDSAPIPGPEPEVEKEEEDDEKVSAEPPSLPSRDQQAPAKAAGAAAIAQYDYEKDEDNEVEFTEGDLIIEIDFVDEEWWFGKNSRTGEVGVFPASYVALEDAVEEESSKAATEEVPKNHGQSATAEYDYEKEEDNEISFKEGDLIIEIDFIDLDWWSGKHSITGEVGVFPGNYVKLH